MHRRLRLWDRQRTLFSLLALCLILLGYFALFEWRGRWPAVSPGRDAQGPVAQAVGEALLSGLISPEKDKGNLVQLVVQQRPREATGTPVPPVLRSLSLRRYEVGGRPQWWLDAPHLRADDAVCEELYAELLATPVRRRLSGARREAARFGLSDETYRLRLSLRQGHELRFGDDAPGDLIYVARDQEPDVLVADHRLFDLLRGDRAHFSSFLLTTREVDIAAAQRLQIGTLLITRRPSSWVMTQPGVHPARARLERVEEVLRTLRSARATHLLLGSVLPLPFFDLGGAPTSLSPSSVVVKLDGIEQFYTGSPCPQSDVEEYVVRADTGTLCFAREDIARVTPGYARLRELRLLPFSPSEVRRLRLGPADPSATVAETPIEITIVERQSDGSFRIAGPPGTAKSEGEVADTEAVRAYLTELASLGAEEPGRVFPIELGEGRLEIETEAGDRTALQVVQGTARARGGSRALVKRDEEEPFLVPAEAVALLREGRLRFASRLLQSFSPYKVSLLTVERTTGRSSSGPPRIEKIGRTGLQGPLGEGWRLFEPVSAPVDAELFTRVLTELSDLRAERLIAMEAVPMHGLDPPAVRFNITVEEATANGTPFRVEIGARHKGVDEDRPGCYARTGASPRVALLPATTCDDLLSLLADGHPLLVDDARVRRVELTSPAGTRVLESRGVAAVLPFLHLLGVLPIAGYGPPPSEETAADLVITVEQDEVKLPAAPTRTVAPAHQVLSCYPADPLDPQRRPLCWLAGRDVSYRVPASILLGLKQRLR